MSRDLSRYRQLLGAGPAAGTVQLTVFVPSVDRAGNPIDQPGWVHEALAQLGRLFRGATAFPPGEGVWRDDANGGNLVFERVAMVTSYATRRALTDAAISDLGAFLRRLGRETTQGEVGVVIGGTYYGIATSGG